MHYILLILHEQFRYRMLTSFLLFIFYNFMGRLDYMRQAHFQDMEIISFGDLMTFAPVTLCTTLLPFSLAKCVSSFYMYHLNLSVVSPTLSSYLALGSDYK